MIFLNKLFRPYDISSVAQPLTFTDVYVFDSKELAPKLTAIEYIEEVSAPTIVLDVQGSSISLPASWQVMIMDSETYTIDTIPVCLSQVYENVAPGFTFVNNSGILKMTKPIKSKMIGINYLTDGVFHHPSISKHLAFILPVGGVSIIAGPHDLSRYISRLTIGDLEH